MDDCGNLCCHHIHHNGCLNHICNYHHVLGCVHECPRLEVDSGPCLIHSSIVCENCDVSDSDEVELNEDCNNNYFNYENTDNRNSNHYATMPPKSSSSSHECNQTNSRNPPNRVPLGTPRTHYPPNQQDLRSASNGCERIPQRPSRQSSLDRSSYPGVSRSGGSNLPPPPVSTSRSRPPLDPDRGYNNGDVWNYRLESLERERGDMVPRKYPKDYDPYQPMHALPPPPPPPPSSSRRDSSVGRYPIPPPAAYPSEQYWGESMSPNYYSRGQHSSNNSERPMMGAEGDYRPPDVDSRYYGSYAPPPNEMPDYYLRKKPTDLYSRRSQNYDPREPILDRGGYQSEPIPQSYVPPRYSSYLPSADPAAYPCQYHSEDDYGQFSGHRKNVSSSRPPMREMRRDVPSSVPHPNQSMAGYMPDNYSNQYAPNVLPHGQCSITRTSTSRSDPRRSAAYMPPPSKDQRSSTMR